MAHHRALRSIVATTLLACAAAGCGGGSGSSGAVPRVPQPPSGNGALSSFAYPAGFLQKSAFVAPASFGTLAVDVVLRMRNPDGLRHYARDVSDPRSALYRHFLTPAEIADSFGASRADQDAAIAYYQSQGLAVAGWSQRMMLEVVGSQANLERAFHTSFGLYNHNGEAIVGPMLAPSLPSNVPVVGSLNIVHRTRRYAASIVHAQQAGNGNLSGYSPQQIAAAFDYNGAYAAGFTGTGITVGIIGTGGISVQAPGHVGDVERFRQVFNLAGSGTVSIVSATDADAFTQSSPAPGHTPFAATGFSTPPPVTAMSSTCTDFPPAAGGAAPGLPPSESPTSTCNPEDLEAQIDTEQTASLARDSKIEFYLAYNANDKCVDSNGALVTGVPCPTSTANAPGARGGPGYPYQGLAEVDEELQSAINHNTADVLSISFGGAEAGQVSSPGGSPPAEFDSSGNGLGPLEYAALAAEGIAVFAAAGDSGAEECGGSPGRIDTPCVNYPATDPNVVAVGGVTTALNAAGAFIGPISAWGLQTGAGEVGTGGGLSNYFALPAFQQNAAGVIGSTRNIPDVSLEADPSTGVPVLLYADPIYGRTTLSTVGGTSVAAPEMAAMWALVLQACKATAACSTGPSAHPYRLGDPNPLFYQIYATAGYGTTFYDVTYGTNAQLPYCQINACGASTPAPETGPLSPGYTAGVGYDQVTGLGVPFARGLIRAVVKI